MHSSDTARVPQRSDAVLWWSTSALLLLAVGIFLDRKATYYLATVQLGYLTFARDLLHGHVFHHWPVADALQALLPARTDMLSQTYVYDHGALWCRYSPGFPLLVAAWTAVFGSDAVHSLNPTLFLVLLAVILGLASRLVGNRWWALVAVVLVVASPSLVQLWALTPLADVAAHLAALLGLLLLVPESTGPVRPLRAAIAGFALGFAVTTRNDAALYLLPAAFVVGFGWHRRALACFSVGLVVGLAPFLVYNWKVSGNPLWPTQGMEIESFFDPLPTSGLAAGPMPGWHGATMTQVQGGALRFRNLPDVLPGNLTAVAGVYGPTLLGLALWGTAVAAIVRPILFRAVVPYVISALVFFSCWSRPNGRFLMGVHLMVPLLIVEGIAGTVELARRRSPVRVLPFVVAASLVVATGVAPIGTMSSGLPNVTRIVGWGGVLVLLASGLWPERRLMRDVLVSCVAVGIVGLTTHPIFAHPSRATFQGTAVERARANTSARIPPGSVVISTEDIGRPAENMEWYDTGVSALYLTDLERWRLPLHVAAEQLLSHGLTPYLLLPPPMATSMTTDLASHGFDVTPVADVAPAEAMDYFVAAPFHRGVALSLVRISRR